VTATEDDTVVEAIEEPVPAVVEDLPEDRDEAVNVLLETITTLRDTADAHLDDLQRVAAEFENFRKRAERDRREIVDRAAERVLEALLPVLDSFDQAFVHEPQSPSEENLLAGVRSTFHQLMDVLRKEGLEMAAGAGEPFDPTVHEAVAGGGDGHLVVDEEMRRGYLVKGKVLRPALVTVRSTETETGDEG
jgi:molecular chaperone GrpE